MNRVFKQIIFFNNINIRTLFFILFIKLIYSYPLLSYALSKPILESHKNIKFENVIINGNHTLNYQDLAYIFEPYISKTINDYHHLINEITHGINFHYMSRGYLFSMVSKVEVKGNVLHVNILEGSINDVVFPLEFENIKEIKYVNEYIHKLKSLKPFNTSEAEKYILLLRRLLGPSASVYTVFLDPDKIDNKDPKTVDLFITDYKKVNGTFEINNAYNSYIGSSSSYNMESIVQNTGYFTMGKLITKIYNPYNAPGNLTTFLTTSGDNKENVIFSQYQHQMNLEGTLFKLGGGYDQFCFNKRDKEFFTLITGLSHPLFFTVDKKLLLSSILEFYSLEKKHKDYTDGDNRTNVAKLVLETNYETLGFLNSKHEYEFEFHLGRANFKHLNSNQINYNSTFNKFSLSGRVEFPLPQNYKLKLIADGKFSNSKKLPIDESFNAGKSIGGRGFLPSEIFGKSGIQGTIELSHLTVFNHPFLKSLDTYAYYDTAKIFKLINANKGNNLSSIGLGLDAYLVDNLVINLELNKPILYHRYEMEGSESDIKWRSKKAKLFAGLKYYFAF